MDHSESFGLFLKANLLTSNSFNYKQEYKIWQLFTQEKGKLQTTSTIRAEKVRRQKNER